MNSPLVVAIVCVLGAAAALAQRSPVPNPLVKEGATVRLGEHTYVIPDNNVGGVPNVGIVVGSRGTLVIDPGLGRRNGETVLREVAKINTKNELYIASTHFHPEHTVGYVAFPVTAKYVNSRIQEAEFAELGAGLVSRFADRAPLWADLLKGASRRVADITFDHDYTLDLDGVRVRFLVVGPTHTRGDTVFFVEEDNVLFAGDVVMNNSFVAANPNSSVKVWLSAFDQLEEMRPRTIVPAHGAVGEASLIEINRDVMQAIQMRARTLKSEGRPVDEVAKTVQVEFQAKHPMWGRAQGVAGAARAAYREAP